MEVLDGADRGAQAEAEAEAEAETHEGGVSSGFKLQRSGRYGHTPAYIGELAARFGMALELQRDIVVRKEQATPIPGLVYVLRRS